MTNNEVKTVQLYNRADDFLAIRLDEQKWPRLATIPTATAQARLAEMTVTACVLRGQKAEPEQVTLTAAALWEELRADFPTLTMPEVGKAIKNGTFGKYGEVYGINAVSLYTMVAEYMQSEEKRELTRRVRAEKEKLMNIQKLTDAKFLKDHPSYKPSVF